MEVSTMPELTSMVVVGVDGSAQSMAALKWADSYATTTGARLRIVTTWVWPLNYGSAFGYEGLTPGADALSVLEKARAELTIPETRVETVCREGGAGPVLVAESKDAALLVVGSHGFGAIGRVVLGSVSNHCVNHASCPVLVVR